MGANMNNIPLAVVTGDKPCGPHCQGTTTPGMHHNCFYPNTSNNVLYCECNHTSHENEGSYRTAYAYFNRRDMNTQNTKCHACDSGDHTRHTMRPPVATIHAGW